jgi:predicted AlkP superfamily pyrophosphatase or phosphodiesterase
VRRLLAVLLLLVSSAFAQPLAVRPTVVLVSFDGWRWDYHTRVPVPHLQRLMARGVRAEALVPAFPSKTFPNHYTLVTGLYPGHHGIVANDIFDEAARRTFVRSRPEEVGDAMWWGGEPIWVAAERAGQRTAPFFWPGSEAPIGGVRPAHWQRYDRGVHASERVRRVLDLLDRPAHERPTFLTIYFEDVDAAGHEDGPDSQAVRDATIRTDSYLGQLTAGLEQRGLLERVNIIVISDHGMAATATERVVLVDDYISLDDVVIADINPTLGLFPRAGREEAVYRALRRAHPRLAVYRRAETPRHWHFRDHPRIPPIVGVADVGWQVMRRRSLRDLAERVIRGAGGQHGYDPRHRSMHGIFVAAGPAFRQGATVPAFGTVDVYNVLARILGVPAAGNDGDPGVVRQLLH